jgi:DNA repair protein RadD
MPLSSETGIDLRDYQTEIVAQFERNVAVGQTRIILVAPTGAGKTVIACAIIAATPRRVLVISHRREIVNQKSDLGQAHRLRSASRHHPGGR